MVEFALLKPIIRKIRYQKLDTFIGKKVVIHKFDTIFDEIKEALSLPKEVTVVTKDRRAIHTVIAHHGLIDIRYHVPDFIFDNALIGIEAMRYLHFGLPQEQASEEEIDDDDEAEWIEDLLDLQKAFALDYLGEMVKDLDQNGHYYLLLLETIVERPEGNLLKQLEMFNRSPLGFPNNFFPREFVVLDAAVCNTRFAWKERHFYHPRYQ